MRNRPDADAYCIDLNLLLAGASLQTRAEVGSHGTEAWLRAKSIYATLYTLRRRVTLNDLLSELRKQKDSSAASGHDESSTAPSESGSKKSSKKKISSTLVKIEKNKSSDDVVKAEVDSLCIIASTVLAVKFECHS